MTNKCEPWQMSTPQDEGLTEMGRSLPESIALVNEETIQR